MSEEVDYVSLALEALADVPCTFWACRGPDQGIEAMITCSVCQAIIHLRAAQEAGAPAC